MSCSDDEGTGEVNAPVRNRFYYGKQMGVAQFQREQDYYRGQLMLVSRLVHGAGTLCGLTVTYADGLVVSRGIALDGLGRLIVVPEVQTLALGEVASGRLWLCYKTCCVQPAPAPCGDPCHPSARQQYDAILESFELKLESVENPEVTPVSASAACEAPDDPCVLLATFSVTGSHAEIKAGPQAGILALTTRLTTLEQTVAELVRQAGETAGASNAPG